MTNLEAPSSQIPGTRVRSGDVIADKYVVEKVLAEGGMGVIVAAQHKQLRRRVALKFLLPELCAMREVVTRFLREAQAMTTIQNEHVARVLDVGTTSDGAPYMVMEYLEGEDLGQTLERRGRLPVTEAVGFVLQGMEALAEAHMHGFVHRDLKPSNLFVTHRPDGSPLVKVLDFGISKVVANDGAGGADLTHAQGLLGSPLYMAPEQIRSSKSVDTRADIWTLGIILYELVAGRPPFEGESVPAVLAAIIADDPPSLRASTPDVPPKFEEIVMRCLRRNRDERYPSVAALAADLQDYARGEALHSIERIEKIAQHHQRVSSPIDLSIKTPPKAQQPVSLPPSPLAATAHVPSTKRESPDDSTFGKYKLIALLGQGGMADVFLAVLAGPEGLGFSKLVVIKRLRGNLASDPEFVAMLVDEARIAAKLNHPNVVQTHEVGVINNEYYIAMEYLDGQPLNRVLLRTRGDAQPGPASVARLNLAFRLGLVRDMLAGIHHAHELADFDGTPLGLVHRDVTPQNVFITYEGQVKVVDFGIAKARGRATETQQGIVKGKVAYMAPEQAAGQDIDRRADVFSAGVVLWELLTGERMWKGVDDVAIIQRLMLDKIPSSPRAVNADVPKALDAIVKKALSKKKADRFETAHAFLLEIERYMESEGLKFAPRELGEYVATLFADRRKQTRSLIESQLSLLRSASPHSIRSMDLRDSNGGAPLSSPSGMRLQRLDQEPVSTDDISRDPVMARSHAPTDSQASSNRSRLAVVAGMMLVVGIIVFLVVARSKSHAPENGLVSVPTTELTPSATESTPPLTPPPTAPTTSAPPAGTVHLALNGRPASVEFSIDDGPKTRGPLIVTRPQDHQTHQITASAAGYRSETKEVSFDSDVTWNVQLSVARSGAATPTRSAAPVASEAPSETARPAASGRKKRELDPDNPYAKTNP